MSCACVDDVGDAGCFWCKRDTVKEGEMTKALKDALRRAEAAGLATASSVDEDKEKAERGDAS